MVDMVTGAGSTHVAGRWSAETLTKVVASVSVFQNQAGADESNRMAADWVRQEIAGLMAGPPEITAGEVNAHKAA